MKKIILLIFILLSSCFCDDNYELRLYEKILPSIFEDNPIFIYTDEDSFDVLKDSSKFHIVENCDDSVVVLLGKNLDDLPYVCQDKPIFSTSYRYFKTNANSFGAFYWSKGRPQIRFKKLALEKFHLQLPKNFRKYVK